MTRVEHTYVPKDIESKWQKRWTDAHLFDVDFDPKKPKKYVLAMFPYPSGKLHMGHVRNYSISDVMARYFRMRGYNVLHPMGWDAFGLPAENAAIQKKVHPKKWTYENIAAMKEQFNKLGVSFDWRREVTTCDVDYYQWEQLMFLKMYRQGLAYRDKRTLNWCPSCQTVLANEEAADGICWRCDSKVELRDMDQWFLKITHYADQLLKDLDQLKDWPARITTMQENWIGKSAGAEIEFRLAEDPRQSIRIFTTRADTLMGVTFMSIAPEHPVALKLSSGKPEAGKVKTFIDKIKRLSHQDRIAEGAAKEGVFSGFYAIHPITSARIPVWIANFVLMGYGTGAVMAVPGHDERDFEFARKYGLPIKEVIRKSGESAVDFSKAQNAMTEPGVLVNSGEFDGLESEAAKKAITETLKAKGLAEFKVQFRLRDWGISRQRYWGAPIPMIHCPKDGIVEVPEKDLPVKLPENVEFKGTGGSPLAQSPDFMNVKCPRCGGPAMRDPDTMATFVESSWYYARFCAVDHGHQPLDKKQCDQWLPIDHYIGGVEHATGHLLYFRFWHKLMRDWGWVKGDEPAKELICQGMVYKDGAKMSKSKGNVVDPDAIVEKFGADTARLFILFAAPIEKDLEWSDQGVEGSYRFLGRVFRLVMNSLEDLCQVKYLDSAKSFSGGELSPSAKKLRHILHKTIKNVTNGIEQNFHYNTAISFMMEMVNDLYLIDLSKADEDAKGVFKSALRTLVLLLAPFAPHLSDELWEALGEKGFTLSTAWPTHDESAARASEKEIVFQVNGKVRDKALVADGISNDEMKKLALANAKVREFMKGTEAKKVIVVPGKLVNVVV